MGLFEKLFPKKAAEREMYSWFRTLGGYTPVYTSFDGGLYEMYLTRACIHTFATHVSKLKPVVSGPGSGKMGRVLDYRPNPWQDTKKYLYRLATIYKAENTAFIVPVYEEGSIERLAGYYPVRPSQAQVVESGGVPYMRFSFPYGQIATLELKRIGIMTQMQYRDDFFGETNAALRPVMELIHAQNQSIINGVKASGNPRFLAQLGQILKPEAMKEEQRRLVADNLGPDNSGGVMMFDAKYSNVKQIVSQPYIVDAKQAEQIRESAFDYFGMNDAILQAKYTPDQWAAYYESQVEPFAIEAGLVHTNMTYDLDQVAKGKKIMFSTNRLQHMTMADKLTAIRDMFDRGMLNQDGAMEILQMPPIGTPDAKKYYTRRDYAEVSALNREDGVILDEGGEENASGAGPGIPSHEPAAADGSQQAD